MIVAGLGFLALFALCLLGVPLGFALLTVGACGFAVLRSFDAAFNMVAQQALSAATNYDFTVLPMFVLMGALIDRANLSRELYDACQSWLGHRRGGLAMATVAACGTFAAVSGSSVATAATMAKISVPEMRRFGYDDRLASGSIAAGGTLGILIPPSVPMVIYGVLTQTDIGHLFIAGIIPGLLLILLYFGAIGVVVRLRPSLAPRVPSIDWSERLSTLSRVWGVIVLFVAVIGSMYFGIATPTEAAAIGAAGALLFAVYRRRLDWRGFVDALVDTGFTTTMLMIVVIGTFAFSNLITLSGAPFQFISWAESLHLSPFWFLVLICVLYLGLGCIFESLGMLMLTVPILFPITRALGIDPVWFGIIVVISLELGLITPPVGMNVFVVKSVIPDLALRTIYAGIWPFLVANLICLALILIIPQLALFLPHLMP